MPNRITVLISCIFLLCAWGPAAAEKRVALVIGNSEYAHVSPLPNPVNDAADLAAKLEALGFQVSRANNLARHALQDALAAFSDTATGADMAIVYYAGHGIGVDKQNYLVPVDARLSTDRKIRFETVPLDTVLASLEGVRGVRMVLLDACRNNPFEGKMKVTSPTRSLSRGLQRVEPARGTLISFAAKDGTTADDGTGRNSPYTAALLKHLDQPGLELQFMFRKVRDEVLSATGGGQEPFTYGSLPGEQIFLKPPETKAPEVAAPQVSALAVELAYWNAIKDADDPALVRSYIEKYPEGQFVLLAKARLAKLTKPAEPAQRAASDGLVLKIQTNLIRLGCSTSKADGQWGAKSKRALAAFQRHSKQKLTALEPTQAVLDALGKQTSRICPSAGFLTGAELRSSHRGRCIAYWGKTKGAQCYLANGSAHYTDSKWGKDTGKWWVQGNQLCEKWKEDDEQNCERVRFLGDGKYVSTAGYTWRFTK